MAGNEDDRTYALEQASKWAARIEEWRKQGTPIPHPITVEIPGETITAFSDRLSELIGCGVLFVGGNHTDPLAECWFEVREGTPAFKGWGKVCDE